MDKQRLRDWLWPLLCPGVSYREYWKLLCELGSPEEILAIGERGAEQRQMRADLQARLNPSDDIRQKIEAEIEKTERWQSSNDHHHLIVAGDPRYPDLLREIDDPPPVLFASGSLSALDYPSVALVGSRHCTPYGVKITRRLARDMVDAGFVVTSGLALGIDAVAHNSCVERGKPTIAILGSGLGRIYPQTNFPLAQRMIEQGGLLLSEFPLSTAPARYRFPQRNRLISGLSLATCVIEASLKSGSLITARQALDQNRQVFAVPGSIDSPNSRGCHRLLREGAAVAENAADIKEPLAPLLQGQLDLLAQKDCAGHGVRLSDHLTQNEAKIVKHVAVEPMDTDALLRHTGLDVSDLQRSLARLELKGQLIDHGGKWFPGV